MMFL
jgi:hypothetical protein